MIFMARIGSPLLSRVPSLSAFEQGIVALAGGLEMTGKTA
jgi:hypothetical protein